MPYILLFFGIILFVAGIRGTNNKLWTLVKGDIFGSQSFVIWLAAIAIVGGAGYIPKLKPLSVAFMTLLLIVLLLSNKGVIGQLQQMFSQGIKGTVSTAPNFLKGSEDTGSGLQPLNALPSLDLRPSLFEPS